MQLIINIVILVPVIIAAMVAGEANEYTRDTILYWGLSIWLGNIILFSGAPCWLFTFFKRKSLEERSKWKLQPVPTPRSLKVSCPSCKQSYKIAEDCLGQTANCSACGHDFVLKTEYLRKK